MKFDQFSYDQITIISIILLFLFGAWAGEHLKRLGLCATYVLPKQVKYYPKI